MKLNNKIIPYTYFIENLVIRRKLFTSGKAIYTGEFKTERDTYSDTVTFNIDLAEDIPEYDKFAREQLIRKLLFQINKGK